jgi:hypothetical protein
MEGVKYRRPVVVSAVVWLAMTQFTFPNARGVKPSC